MKLQTLSVLALLVASAAGAQFPRRYQPMPQYWVGLSYGYMDGGTIYDTKTADSWQIGYSSQIRATAEKAIQGASLGVSAGFGTAPVALGGCTGCNASVDISQFMLFLHGGGGTGFHGMYTLEAGASEFSNLRNRDSDTKLGVPSQYDVTFGFGGGLGYGFSPTMEGYVGEVMDLVLHDQGSSVNSSAPRFYTFRMGFRVGF